MISNEQYDYLKTHQTFAQLTREAFDQLARHIRFRKIAKGQVIFYAQDPRDYFFVLPHGYARIEQYDETDTFNYLDYIREDSAFPFGGMFQDKDYFCTAIAITDVECFIIPMDLFESLSMVNPRQLVYICKKLSRVLHFQELRLRNALQSKATERVIQVLALLYWDMCQRNHLATLPFEIHILELSQLAATTRETVSHVLKQLMSEGKITYCHKKLTYLDTTFFLENLTEAH